MAPPIIQSNKLNLLGLVGAACSELGIPIPTQLFGNTDNQAIQLLALAVREGKEFYNQAMRHDGWQALRQANIFTITGVSGLTGNTTINSSIVTGISSTAGLGVGWAILTTGIPNDTHIVSIDSPTQVTVDTPATATTTAAAMSFGQDSYSLPNDFESLMTTTSWDRAFRWQLLGPLNAQEWQVLKSGISPTGPRRRFRIMGNKWYVDPPPTAPETVVFEYYSNAWCQSAAGASQNTWKADTDYYTLSDDAFILGLKWRFKAAKGLDYTQEKLTYDYTVERLMARDGGNRDLPLNARSSGMRLLNEANVPDTGYGS